MQTTIFIPKTIKVGFQERKDTYTKKLAYVIYTDERGKLRKETSWQSWRDKKIDPEDFDNTPTSGFVLNKKVGDYKSDWNHRMAYCRVYDPRGFEFEITIENLLYILENTSSIKGKGLEGDFVYGWSGSDLILIPTSSPDYDTIKEFTDIIMSKSTVKVKDLIPGATYLTKKNEEMIYLGKFDYWDNVHVGYREVHSGWSRRESVYEWKCTKRYYFKDGDGLEIVSGLNKFIKVINKEPVQDFAFLIDKLQHCDKIYRYEGSRDKFLPLTKVPNGKGYYDDSETVYFTYEGLDYKATIESAGYYHGPNPKIDEVKFKHNDTYSQSTREEEVENLFKDCKDEESILKIANEFGFIYKQRYLSNGKEYNQKRSTYNFFKETD